MTGYTHNDKKRYGSMFRARNMCNHGQTPRPRRRRARRQPDPSACRKRDYLQRRSHNPAVAFATHKTAILRYMRDLDVAFTNNQADVTCGP